MEFTPYEKAQIAKKLHEILDIVLEVNDIEKRDKEGAPAAFFNFSGHVCDVQAYVYPNGWSKEGERKADDDVYMTTFDDFNILIQRLEHMKVRLSAYRPHEIEKKKELEEAIDAKRTELNALYKEYETRYPDYDTV